MIKRKTTVLAAVMMTAIVATPAHAYVMASSVVQLSDFKIFLSSDGSTQGSQADRSNFNSLVYNSNADLDGSLTGSSDYHLHGNSANTDFPVQCIGSGCGALSLGENAFTHIAPPPAGDYTAGDQQESGAPITGISGLTSPASIQNSAYSALANGTGAGSANSNNGLSSTFSFSVSNDTYLNFAGTVAAFLNVAITSDEVAPSTAQANYQFSFSIAENGNTIWGYAPDLLGNGFLGYNNQPAISVNAPVGTDTSYLYNNPGVNFSVFTPLLTAGHSYVLTARTNTNVDVTRVPIPEPGAVALLGLGLAGLGFARRRGAAK